MINHTTKQSAALLSSLLLGLVFTSSLPGSAETFSQKHPRRAEVLRRDGNLNGKLNCDKGKLGGRYGQLKSEDASIRRQEKRDARINGGYITKGQQKQLNHEENRLNNQINKDYQ